MKGAEGWNDPYSCCRAQLPHSSLQVSLVAKTLPRRGSVTAPQRKVFLDTLAEGWSTTHAAVKAGHHRSTWYRLRDSDAEFAELWREAEERGTDLLEDEAMRRAKGYEERMTEYHPDGSVKRTTVTERHDTTTLNTLLKGRRPEKFREQPQVQITNVGEGAVQIEGFSPPGLLEVVTFLRNVGALDDVIDGEVVEDEPAQLATGG